MLNYLKITKQERKLPDKKSGELEKEKKINFFPLPQEMETIFLEAGYEDRAEAYKTVLKICSEIEKAKGQALLVGGGVRDRFFNKIPKDFDLEVYGLIPEKIKEIVSQFGRIEEVGESFGVLKVFLENGLDIDVSLPRRDSKKSGEKGHRAFDIETDPFMSVEEAAKRRDYTINSMAANPLTGELYDYYGGLKDIKQRILRVTDAELFKDDPLRILRGIQFIGRFGLVVDEQSLLVIKKMIPDLKTLPKERLFEEWKKLLLKSDKPSLGLMAGMNWGVFDELHAELPPLAQTPQEPEWHPEGDVWMHTLMSVDESVKFCQQDNLTDDQRLNIILATMCHDYGKPATTVQEEKDGVLRWISHGHEQAGEQPTKSFLGAIGASNEMQEKIIKLVTNHLIPSMWFIDATIRGNKISKGAFNRLAERIAPATLQELVLVAEADHAGRGPFMDQKQPWQYLLPDGFPAGPWFLKIARELGVEKSKPQNLITGKELIEFGLKPGKEMGEIIRLANDLRDDENYTKAMFFAAIDGLSDNQTVIEHLKSLFNK